MKNKSSSFERHFKIEKNGVLFVTSFAIFEILTMLYYAYKINDDVRMFSQCGAKAQMKNISANKRAVQLKIGTSIAT